LAAFMASLATSDFALCRSKHRGLSTFHVTIGLSTSTPTSVE
jgi:hypothetical protein